MQYAAFNSCIFTPNLVNSPQSLDLAYFKGMDVPSSDIIETETHLPPFVLGAILQEKNLFPDGANSFLKD